MVKVLKEKRGIPTVIEYMGNVYSLVHRDNKKGQTKNTRKEISKSVSKG